MVILIIGILAAIAIPSFLSQKSKATAAQAKELARTAETTAETYAPTQRELRGARRGRAAQVEPWIVIAEPAAKNEPG